jgi:hypothetical protein
MTEKTTQHPRLVTRDLAGPEREFVRKTPLLELLGAIDDDDEKPPSEQQMSLFEKITGQ